MVSVRWELMIHIRLREVVLLTESFRTIEVIQYVHDASPVPVVSHTTTIVDVTSSVLQYL